MIEKMNDALAFLREKYGFADGYIEKDARNYFLVLPGEKRVQLLFWRAERRFVELKKIIEDGTLERVSTFRFAHFSGKKSMEELLFTELDILRYFSGSTVESIFAVMTGNTVCNLIVRLVNGMSGIVECGVKLPPEKDDVDRHEIIAGRGTASDRMVDTQVPQSSMYLWTEKGEKRFTDVDMELFGLPDEAVFVVRSACMLLGNPELVQDWEKDAIMAANAVKTALKSSSFSQIVFTGKRESEI